MGGTSLIQAFSYSSRIEAHSGDGLLAARKTAREKKARREKAKERESTLFFRFLSPFFLFLRTLFFALSPN